MKIFFRCLYMLLALVGAGCNFLPSTTPPESDERLVIKVTSADDAEWCDDDEIMLIEGGVAYRTAQCINVEDDNRATFTLDEPNGEGDEIGYGAVFPLGAIVQDDSINLERVRLAMPTTQMPQYGCFDVCGDLRVALYRSYEQMPKPLELEFQRVAAIGALIVENLPEGSTISQVKLSVVDAKPFVGELIIDLRTGAQSLNTEVASSEIVLNYSQSVRADQPLYFMVLPLELEAGSSIEVEIVADAQVFTHTLTLTEALNFTPSQLTELVISLPEPEVPQTCTFRRVNRVTSGKVYLVAAERRVASAFDKYTKYGYMSTVDGDTDDDGVIIFDDCAHAFYIESKDGGYTIRQVTDNRYIYQYKEYNSLNVDAMPTEGDVWQIARQGDLFKITNVAKGKYLQYVTNYDSFGSYSDSQGVLPALYELEGEVILPSEDDGSDDTGGGDSGGDEGVVGDTTLEIKYGLELPAKRTDGAYPNAKVVSIRAADEDNYTHYYDVDTYTSLWVAYPLSARHMGSYGRPDAWDWNPSISISDQVNLCSRSYAGDYSRGHLIPNASRNGIREMQLQTFYVTNAVPQVQAGFNGGIWQKLEAALQSIGEQQTIYIVTGVAFNKQGESRTITYTKAKDDTKSVPVPNYFYKVVLKVKCDEEGNVVDAMTVGFWFENKSYSSNSYANYAVSVDDIETWTGFDYFPEIGKLQAVAEQNASWTTFKSW